MRTFKINLVIAKPDKGPAETVSELVVLRDLSQLLGFRSILSQHDSCGVTPQSNIEKSQGRVSTLFSPGAMSGLLRDSGTRFSLDWILANPGRMELVSLSEMSASSS